MTILIIAEHDNRSIHGMTRSAVTAAVRMGGDVHVLLAGADCAAAAAQAAGIAGVSKVRVADAAHYGTQTAENIAALVVQHAAQYSHIVAPGSSHGKNLMPRIAALLDVAQISDIVAVESADTFVRPVYAGNALLTVRSGDPVKAITVRCAAFEPAGPGGAAAIEALAAGPDLGLATVTRRELTRSARPELVSADIIVSGGRGLGSGEKYREVLEPLADALGAALGASRAAVDAGFAPNDCQIGQTGKIVAPQLYIAIGISGAIQHLAGMKDSKVIVAINKDEEAPIFQVADYGLAADLFAAVPELTAALA
ncbi:Electron transfer flavoprotein, alpha subunit [Castellaniella defragrans 65Phen]|jgi:electron transfer flavoprotein alpha subunit|uniref:Electron transfer flavoprotein subunit alpha n=2 Tax=Castellaniella defragrans TaxID=75697 RepID=W8X545_CASD6|nr:FAD-binding protein [Castellaniella defragrans]KAB0622754.1 electron transfer flavoprotein subunit alpha [Castellaniella defragrans]MBB6085228.1 electron transfer flavoprotein alpha subunit [Castellaniella defragrans]CDM25302.1 Electron transfer flavoprotein, alpha subunit [Castellaniella defragrans 65Phen]